MVSPQEAERRHLLHRVRTLESRLRMATHRADVSARWLHVVMEHLTGSPFADLLFDTEEDLMAALEEAVPRGVMGGG